MKRIIILLALLIPINSFAKRAITPAEKTLNSLISATNKTVDFDSLISAKELADELKQDNKPVLVDVRPADEFRKCFIPGSLNVPLYLLKTKSRFKNKKLVLLNEGHSYHLLTKELQKLKSNAFTNVRILRGGLVAWNKARGQIKGDRFYLKDLNKLSPKEFFPDRDYEEIEIFQIHKRGETLGRKVLPQAMGMPAMTSARGTEKLAQTINALIARKKNKLLFVVIATSGEVDLTLENTLQRAIDEPLFFLNGGTKAYESFLKGQVNLWLNAGRKRKEDCATCQ